MHENLQSPQATERSEIEAAAYGFRAYMDKQQQCLAQLSEQFDRPGRGAVADPVVIDSSSGCVAAYVAGMNWVRERFWTTTFFTSGFWTVRDPRIMDANRTMHDRLHRNGGSVRRLFLLDQPVEPTLRGYREQRALLDRLGRVDALTRMDEDFENLRRNVASLAAAGCELRVFHDAEAEYRRLPAAWNWDPMDSELAIYDQFRVDLFSGGRSGRILGLTGYCPPTWDYSRNLHDAEQFFETLWRRSGPMDEFLTRMAETLEASRNKIHYRANWLARYEFALDADDVELKNVEAALLVDAIRREHRWGRLSAYLDIGTCTGRYPLLLADAVGPAGIIVGLDDDGECLEFARANAARIAPGDPRFRWRQTDFTAADAAFPDSPFDLITCMMSTLSHFAHQRSAGWDDALQSALRRMHSILARHGLLIFSTWSESACRDRRFLSIYNNLDRARLAQWTPPPQELAARLERAGFGSVQRFDAGSRLHFWICRPGPTKRPWIRDNSRED